jgi:hypothetical protein
MTMEARLKRCLPLTQLRPALQKKLRKKLRKTIPAPDHQVL